MRIFSELCLYDDDTGKLYSIWIFQVAVAFL